MPDGRLNGRNVLDRTGSGADARHPLTGEIDVVVPFGGVEGGTGEGVDAGDVRHRRTRELAHRRNQDVGGEGFAAGGAHLPDTARGIEFRIGDLDAEADLARQIVLLGDRAHVRVDVALLGKAARPVGFGFERPRVQRGGHIAGRPRIGVLTPDTAQIAGLLDDGEIVDTGALQFQRHAEAGESGADDHDGWRGSHSRRVERWTVVSERSAANESIFPATPRRPRRTGHATPLDSSGPPNLLSIAVPLQKACPGGHLAFRRRCRGCRRASAAIRDGSAVPGCTRTAGAAARGDQGFATCSRFIPCPCSSCRVSGEKWTIRSGR